MSAWSPGYKNAKHRRINYASVVNHKQHLCVFFLVLTCLLALLATLASFPWPTPFRSPIPNAPPPLNTPARPKPNQATGKATLRGVEPGSVPGESRSHGSVISDLNARQRKVVDAFEHAWRGYERYAWGRDELHPISQKGTDWFGLGLTLVDALDTMHMMGLVNEFSRARTWVQDSLDIKGNNRYVNVFETTIRVLGGLLSTYALTRDQLFLDKSVELANALMPAFNSPTHIPWSDVNLATGAVRGPKNGPKYSSLAEVTTIQLEFKYLSWLTGDERYRAAVDEVITRIDGIEKTDGLAPMFVDIERGRFKPSTITLGARGDSYYEYLLKQWVLTGKKEKRFKEMYETAVNGIVKNLVMHESLESGRLWYLAEKKASGAMSKKMDHLVCFFPGLLALGHMHGALFDRALLMHHGLSDHLELAEALLRTCFLMYESQPMHLAPEIVHFEKKVGMFVKDADAHNLLRPETVESLLILYRVTKDEKYREWGWKIFQAFEKHSKIASGGYSSIKKVTADRPEYMDKMESFFLGETLKYFFLLFADEDLFPLDTYVFNTEGMCFKNDSLSLCPTLKSSSPSTDLQLGRHPATGMTIVITSPIHR